MGVFSEFVYGEGVVYGPTVSTTRADVLGHNLIILYLDEEVLTNAAYYAVDNYVFAVVEGSGEEIVPLEILPVNEHAIDKIYIRTSYHSGGTTYSVTMSGLSTRTGGAASGEFEFMSRSSKLDSMYRNIPSHFSSEANSLVKNVLLAIAASDDTIGGSRDDRLP